MNAEKLLESVKFFEEEPLRLWMSTWVNELTPRVAQHYPKYPLCGTTACLAGSALFLEAKRRNVKVLELVDNMGGYIAGGMAIFDITVEQTEMLFYDGNWPEPWATDYQNLEREFDCRHNKEEAASIKKLMVKVLRNRVEHFIETNGKE